MGPLLLVKCGDTQIDYTTKTKLVGAVIDNKLTCRDQLEKTHMSLSTHSLTHSACAEENAIPSTQTTSQKHFTLRLIPQITYCISVWGNCSVARLYEIKNLHIKIGSFIHRVSQNVLESRVCVLWERHSKQECWSGNF